MVHPPRRAVWYALAEGKERVVVANVWNKEGQKQWIRDHVPGGLAAFWIGVVVLLMAAGLAASYADHEPDVSACRSSWGRYESAAASGLPIERLQRFGDCVYDHPEISRACGLVFRSRPAVLNLSDSRLIEECGSTLYG